MGSGIDGRGDDSDRRIRRWAGTAVGQSGRKHPEVARLLLETGRAVVVVVVVDTTVRALALAWPAADWKGAVESWARQARERPRAGVAPPPVQLMAPASERSRAALAAALGTDTAQVQWFVTAFVVLASKACPRLADGIYVSVTQPAFEMNASRPRDAGSTSDSTRGSTTCNAF